MTRLAVLVSGGGRSLENLAETIAAGELEAELALVLADRPGAFALERARRRGIPTAVVPRRDFESAAEFSRAVFEHLDGARIELALLAGFLRLLVVPEAWLGRVMNIHPALLPAYGGKGFYGERVHRAVLEAGESRSGCTVHYVTNEYDAGPIILQREVPVLPSDTVETLAARVFAEEQRAYPEAVRRHLDGRARFPRGAGGG